jgi:hypothetical protein
MTRRKTLKAASAAALLAALGAAVYAQDKFDKYSLKSPDGIAFADFRGYEDWAVISTARTDEELKVIVATRRSSMLSKPAPPATASLSRKAQRW